jgi:hypothetical protein
MGTPEGIAKTQQLTTGGRFRRKEQDGRHDAIGLAGRFGTREQTGEFACPSLGLLAEGSYPIAMLLKDLGRSCPEHQLRLVAAGG